jgi:hypothetical protein
MTIRRLILLLTCTAVIFALTGCSSVNPNTITVALSPAPPTGVPAGATASVGATVTNDSRHEGVDWTVQCSSSSCGSISPTHTASGASTTFTAPSDIPDGNTVTIIATSTRNPAKSASASPTIQFSNTMLVGNYVFEAAGQDSTVFTTKVPYYVAGVFTADGAGNVSAGELTYGNGTPEPAPPAPPIRVVNEPITGGTYTIGTDGRGTINLITANTSIGVSGTLTLGTVLASSQRGLITEFDTNATSSGSLDLQTAVNPPLAGFAFVVNGNDAPTFGPLPFAIGGVLNMDGLGGISVAGSVADADEGGIIVNHVALVAPGTVSAPDAFGAVTVDFDLGFAAPFGFIGYIVDDTHIKLAESDPDSSMSGQAIGQGANTGTFVDNTFFSGAFVYGISGQSVLGQVALAAAFTADGAGGLTGETDENVDGAVVHDTFTGTYTVDITTPGNTGRTTATTTFDTPPNPAGPTLIFYLTGSGNPPLVLNTDASASQGAGIAFPQSGPAADGAFALGFSATDSSLNEIDGTAQITADGSAGTFSGTGDINVEDNVALTFTPDQGETVSGTFTASAIDDGRFDSTLTIGSSTFTTALYIADPTQGFIIETDDLQVALGIFIAAQE